jgi:predicted P-loop ATPase
VLNPFGSDLSEADHQKLAQRWITGELAEQAGLRRADSYTVRQMFGRKQGDLSGIIIPNLSPWDHQIREYRARLDNPPLEYRSDGGVREVSKYIQPSGRGNLFYFPPGTSQVALESSDELAIVTEGEFKALALYRLAHLDSSDVARFLPIAVAGVYSWRGTVGKTIGPDGGRRDVKGVIPDFERVAWKGRRVIIAFDADSETKPKVRAARWQLTAALIERGALVGNLLWPITEGKGIDDWLATVGPDPVWAAIQAVEFGDWRTRLVRNEDGRVVAGYENTALYFENSPEWTGVLGYNSFTGGIFVLKPPPPPVTAAVGEELEDHFDTEVSRWFERHHLMVKPDMVRAVIEGVARRNSFHPPRDYMEALPEWDGKPRTPTWLIDYCGVESSDSQPNEYAMAAGEKFLISVVARIFEPGAKCDSLLVLEGPQGIGKSSVARILAGVWFSDQLPDMYSKDAAMALRSILILELAELDVLNRNEMARAKAFLTVREDRLRLPYGRRMVTFPRQCVFFGTTNSDTWLKDETGGRRFWPVRCRGSIDLAGLARDRDQLWAEALHRYRADMTWWFDTPDLVQAAAEETRERHQADPWQEQIARWLASPEQRRDGHGHPVGDFASNEDSVTISDILLHCLGKPISLWVHADKMRVSGCLVALGWKRFKAGPRNAREWRYRRGDAGQ